MHSTFSGLGIARRLLALSVTISVVLVGLAAYTWFSLRQAAELVGRPEVLLLDEPFSALDAFTRADLQDHLLDLWHDAEPTLVVVTHDVDEAIALADRIVVMRPRPGRVAAEIAVELPRPRDRVAIIGDNRPQLYWAMTAAQALGGVPPVDAAGHAIWQSLRHAEAAGHVEALVAAVRAAP